MVYFTWFSPSHSSLASFTLRLFVLFCLEEDTFLWPDDGEQRRPFPAVQFCYM